jgi:hypothetical protein
MQVERYRDFGKSLYEELLRKEGHSDSLEGHRNQYSKSSPQQKPILSWTRG